MVKRVIILFLALAVGIFAVVLIYRFQIAQYSAETFIRKNLPDYVRIDKIKFEFKDNRVLFLGFRILNSQGYSTRYLIDIDEIACGYRFKGKNIFEGIEILTPSFRAPHLTIERLRNGKININEKAFFETALNKTPSDHGKVGQARDTTQVVTGDNKKTEALIKLPEEFEISGGKITFMDKFPYKRPHVITFENIESRLLLKLNDSYSAVLSLASTGEGNFNGDRNEVIRWNIFLNPTTPRLTMSNRFEVSNIELVPLEPYYSRYSPFIFKTGVFSGTLIFDFNNGSIGSTNEIRLSHLSFSVKEGYENAVFWETTVNDLVKYLTTSSGDIIFDFKVKGDVAHPKFYLGPISKQALASAAIDTISNVIEKTAGKGEDRPGDLGKAKKYIDLFKSLIEKK